MQYYKVMWLQSSFKHSNWINVWESEFWQPTWYAIIQYLCFKIDSGLDSENIPVRSWFDAEQNCELSNSRLLNGSELYERKLEEDIYISHYYWTYGFAEFTSCVRSIGNVQVL